MVEYDYSKLRGRIVEVYGTQDKFAKALGSSATTISKKLNNLAEWSQGEIEESCRLLSISRNKLPEFFFAI